MDVNHMFASGRVKWYNQNMARPKGSKNAIIPTQKQAEIVQDAARSNLANNLQITHPKKKIALETYYALNGNVSRTCKALKIERRTWYNWLEQDPVFFEAINEQKQEVLDNLKDEALRRALDTSKENDTMLIFSLKSLHPEFKPQRDTMAYQSPDGTKFVLSRGN